MKNGNNQANLTPAVLFRFDEWGELKRGMRCVSVSDSGHFRISLLQQLVHPSVVIAEWSAERQTQINTFIKTLLNKNYRDTF